MKGKTRVVVNPAITVISVRLVALCCFASMTMTWVFCTSAEGQGLFRPLQGLPPGRFVEAPRGLEQILREAEQGIEDGRYSDAIVRLGDLLAGEDSNRLLDDVQGQDFFIQSAPVDGESRPLRLSFLRRVRDLIGGLPAEAADLYELRYGPSARKILDEASESRDWRSVKEVRRRYFHTLAGYESSMLLAQRSMLLGHPLEAMLLLSDIIVSDRAVKYLGQGVLVMHAAAGKAAGRARDDAEENALSKSGEIRVDIEEESLTFSGTDALTQWVTETYVSVNGASRQEKAPETLPVTQKKSYALLGGSTSRNGSDGGQLPLSNERWRLSTTSSPLQERVLRQSVEELASSGKLPPPCWVPLRVDGQLLMRTTERLVGVDYRTGKRVWTYPWQLGYDSLEEESSALEELIGQEQRQPLLSQRVWNDLPYGQISSDGRNVYLLDQLRQVESAGMNTLLNFRGVRRVDNSTNTLVGLELATEGKLRWRLGAEGDTDSFSEAFFLGPPLPVDGRLYVMAEIAGDITLCCLEPDTGKELWRQQLLAVESGGVGTDPIRRVAGAMPSYHEGILICPTGAGAVVAIDLVDRTLRWGASVERNAEMLRSIAGGGRAIEASKLMQRWFSGAAIAANDAVLVTPIESDRLYGFDLLSGETLFPQKNRGYMLYVAGIRDGKFFVVGTHQIRAFEVETGQPVWTTPRDLVSAGQQIAGLGVFGEYDYFVPTTTNEVIQVSLADGTVRQRRVTQYPLGNLIAADGELITQGPTSLSVAFGESTLGPMVEERLVRNPKDFEAMVRKAELLIQREDRQKALELLSEARAMEPDNDEVRMLSVSAILGQLHDDGQLDPSLVATLEPLIDRPRQRIELLGLQVRSAMGSKDSISAITRLVELSRLLGSESSVDSSDQALVDDATRQCTVDSWVAARASEVFEMANEDELLKMNAILNAEAKQRITGSDRLLRSALVHFSRFSGMELLRAELANRMQERQDAVGLERLALGMSLPNAATLKMLSFERLSLLSKAYEIGGMPKDQLRVLTEIQQRFQGAGEDLNSDRTTNQISQQITQLNQQLAKRVWPKTLKLTWDARTTRIIRSLSQTQRFSEMNFLAGEQMMGWRLYGEGRSPLSLLSPEGTRVRIPVDGDVNESEKLAVVSGGVMVVVTRNELIAVNLLSVFSGVGDPVLWQRPIIGDGGNPMSRRSSVTPFDDKVVRYAVDNSMTSAVIPEFSLGPVMGNRLFVLQGGDLIAIDLITAETLWRNAAAPVSGAVLCDGQRVAVVSDSTSETIFFDPLDGRKLGSSPWERGEIWSAAGKHVLAYQATEMKDQYMVSLTDPFSGQDVLTHLSMRANRAGGDEALESSYGHVENARYLNMLSNRGDATLWDLVEGRELAVPKVDPFPSLVGLNVMRLGEKMIWLPKGKPQAPAGPNEPQMQTADGRYHVAVDRLIAFSLNDASMVWKRDFDSTWGCTLMQPSGTPLLFMARSPFEFSTTNRTRRKTLDVMALDMESGDIADLTQGRTVLSGNNQLETKVVVQPNGFRLLVEVGVEHLLYELGVEASEPESENPAKENPAKENPDKEKPAEEKPAEQ